MPRHFWEMRPHLEDGLVIGHTHIQHRMRIDDRLIVNPGSVGQPRDGNAQAAYAILNVAEQDVEMRRVAYNIDRVIDALSKQVSHAKAVPVCLMAGNDGSGGWSPEFRASGIDITDS
jgi:diadenosine tetraphosphatase ApaH/serine/threonine PP2A family protein phosphatase